MSNLIEVAVAPLKADAIERAELEANKLVDRVRTELAAAGNDLQKCAPYPRTDVDRMTYLRQLSRYRLFHAICKSRAATRTSLTSTTSWSSALLTRRKRTRRRSTRRLSPS